MDDRAFFRDVARRVGCDERRAEGLAFVVLQELRARLPAREADDVAAQLPSALRRVWQEEAPAGSGREKVHEREFVGRVRRWADLPDDAESERAVLAVFGAFQHLLSSPHGIEGEAWDVFSVLPKDLKRLWLRAATPS
jgi:uncharacterized protein (DUF2267 family)